jgi:protein Mpv17
MASVPSISPQSLLPLSKPKLKSKPISKFSQATPLFSRNKQKMKSRVVLINSMVEELDVIPVQSTDSTDQQEGVVVSRVESEGGLETELVNGFGASHEGRLSFEGAGEFQGFSSSSSSGSVGKSEHEEIFRLIDRTINATIVLAAGSFAITKLLTIDQDYWHVSLSLCD